MRAIVLDNEAVHVLRDGRHRKHRAVVAHLVGATQRRRRGADVAAVVPTAVRVKAGWSRSHPTAAAINRFRVTDYPLDGATADAAASINRSLPGLGVAGAHIGATVAALPHDDVVVLTSDPYDVQRATGARTVRVVRV